jgi:hypothetical protein
MTKGKVCHVSKKAEEDFKAGKTHFPLDGKKAADCESLGTCRPRVEPAKEVKDATISGK